MSDSILDLRKELVEVKARLTILEERLVWLDPNKVPHVPDAQGKVFTDWWNLQTRKVTVDFVQDL